MWIILFCIHYLNRYLCLIANWFLIWKFGKATYSHVMQAHKIFMLHLHCVLYTFKTMTCTNTKCFTLNSLDKLDADICHLAVQYRCRVCFTMSFQCLYCKHLNNKFYSSLKQVERHITNCHSTDNDMKIF